MIKKKNRLTKQNEITCPYKSRYYDLSINLTYRNTLDEFFLNMHQTNQPCFQHIHKPTKTRVK